MISGDFCESPFYFIYLIDDEYVNDKNSPKISGMIGY